MGLAPRIVENREKCARKMPSRLEVGSSRTAPGHGRSVIAISIQVRTATILHMLHCVALESGWAADKMTATKQPVHRLPENGEARSGAEIATTHLSCRRRDRRYCGRPPETDDRPERADQDRPADNQNRAARI